MSEKKPRIIRIADCYLNFDDISLVVDNRKGFNADFKTGVTVVISAVPPICFEGDLADEFLGIWDALLDVDRDVWGMVK